MSYVHVETTVEGPADAAERFARRFVEDRLAACANVHGPVRSVYWWDGRLERAQEFLITFKTTKARRPALVRAIRDAHPYEVPYLSTWMIALEHPAYARWLTSQVRPAVARARRAPPSA